MNPRIGSQVLDRDHRRVNANSGTHAVNPYVLWSQRIDTPLPNQALCHAIRMNSGP